jgi:uncharacterized protein (DUF1501 family)
MRAAGEAAPNGSASPGPQRVRRREAPVTTAAAAGGSDAPVLRRRVAAGAETAQPAAAASVMASPMEAAPRASGEQENSALRSLRNRLLKR